MFETGSNQWRTFSHWPPAEAEPVRLRLQAGGRMQMESADGQPLSGGTADRLEGASETGFDQYTSDPAKPVPYSQEITNRMTNEYMTDDQRFAARRPDVLVYQTDVLAEDVVIAGPLVAQFFASTSGTDADFVVKLIDVFPDGTNVAKLPNYQMMVRSEVLLGRFRNSYETPEAFV
ncbi:MAG: CocE/NonD family hydrolase, partial [Planctomyces sp.]